MVRTIMGRGVGPREVVRSELDTSIGRSLLVLSGSFRGSEALGRRHGRGSQGLGVLAAGRQKRKAPGRHP